ncbi:MAG: site-specific integrase [Dehalococcoidales bacterium]|nr:site-specific integrase [Dehalococcoidales bacterium]
MSSVSLRDRLLIQLLFRLGCRISEVLAIGVEDVDFEQGTVTIQHLKTRSHLLCQDCGARLGRTHRFCPGCGQGMDKAVAQQHEHRRMRRLPVDGHTLDMIREHIRHGGPVLREGLCVRNCFYAKLQVVKTNRNQIGEREWKRDE